MHFVKNRYVWLAALAAAVLGSAWAVADTQHKPAVAASRPSIIAATGRIEARAQAIVGAKSGGRLEALLKHEGDWVEAGAPLARFEHALEKAALDEAQAESFRACSMYKRVASLHEAKAASDQERDEADAACRLADARVEKARAAVDLRHVRAPFAGRILKTYYETGESVPPGDAPLLVIGDTRGLKVRAELDELDLGRLKVGQSARVTSEAFRGTVFEGRVARASGILGRRTMRSEDPRERVDAKVLEVEIELPPTDKLRPGSSVDLEIETEKP